MKNLILIVFLVITSVTFAGKPDHSILDRLLKDYVSTAGKVNYKGLKIKTDTLDKYLISLKNNPPATDWTKTEKKAYYMNAYNAYTLKFVLSKYPLKSVKDASFSGKDIWNVALVKLGDKSYTLSQVENDILRKMGDPRIHFGINCASYSCPILANKAFTAENTDALLTKLTKNYINDVKHNIISAKKIQVSQIFEWYAADFVKEGQTLIQYLNKYSTIQIEATAKVEYLPYNWSLNE